jgi:hypothetical protein
MIRIISSESGPQPLQDDKRPASAGVTKVEVVVTPDPKTRKERQANAKAQRLSRAQARQQQNAYAPRKRNESQRTAQRKRKRDLFYHSVADLAVGKIAEEQAKARLTTRRKPSISEA